MRGEVAQTGNLTNNGSINSTVINLGTDFLCGTRMVMKGWLFIHPTWVIQSVDVQRTAGYCDGYSLDYSFSAVLATSHQMDGSIPAGKKMQGQIAYEVPKDWKEIEIHITPNYWTGDKLVFLVIHK